MDALHLFDQAKMWECGIPLCKELGRLYETEFFDYTKLVAILVQSALCVCVCVCVCYKYFCLVHCMYTVFNILSLLLLLLCSKCRQIFSVRLSTFISSELLLITLWSATMARDFPFFSE